VRDAFDINLAFSRSELAAPLFATRSSDSTIVNAFTVGDDIFVVARFAVNPDSELAGRAVHDLGRDHPMFILFIERTGDRFRPTGEDQVESGNMLVVQTDPPTLKKLRQLNHHNDH
jgi:Trk K+ transport system NAD-binding subunit